MAELFGFDAYSPKEIAERVENIGVTKARLPLLTVATLGVLAGGFIGLGALYFTLVTSDSSLGFAASRLLGGLTFSLGLILVVVAGAELFTGNNLLVMAWASQRITANELMRNWLIVYFANFAGAMGLVLLVFLSDQWQMGNGAVGANAVRIAAAKAALSFPEAFSKESCATFWSASPSGYISVRRCRLRAQHRQHVLHPLGNTAKRSGPGERAQRFCQRRKSESPQIRAGIW